MLCRYNQLDDTAQRRAREEYLAGWYETHPDDYFTDEDVHTILLTEGGVYDEDGEYFCSESDMAKEGDAYADSEWVGGVYSVIEEESDE